ncbi:tyrosine-type recombinase/integrase [Planctomycetota bacterium]
MTEAEVQKMIALEINTRNRLLIKTLYCGGLRNFEAAGLKWRDLQERQKGGQMTIHGKCNKTHAVLIPEKLWHELMELKPENSDDEPVFKSRKGGHIHFAQVIRIVSVAAERAGIKKKVTPHWLRHSHASHALDRGAPIHLVQQTLAHSSLNTTLLYLHAKPNDSSSMYLDV